MDTIDFLLEEVESIGLKIKGFYLDREFFHSRCYKLPPEKECFLQVFYHVYSVKLTIHVKSFNFKANALYFSS